MNSEWQSLPLQTQQELKNTMNAMQPPQSIEEIKEGLETTEKGGVRQSIRNCLTVFQRDPLLSGAIAYNILTDRKDIIKPIGFHRESTALNDTDAINSIWSIVGYTVLLCFSLFKTSSVAKTLLGAH